MGNRSRSQVGYFSSAQRKSSIQKSDVDIKTFNFDAINDLTSALNNSVIEGLLQGKDSHRSTRYKPIQARVQRLSSQQLAP